jgi:hypothetical protein
VTITLAVHPLAGQPLPVIRWLRVRGEPYVELLHPRGWTIRVPQEWTERGRPAVVPVLDGRPVRLGLAGLVRIATHVRQKLDSGDRETTVAAHETADGRLEEGQQGREERRKTSRGSARVDRSRSGDSPSDARRSGLAGAKDAPRPSRRRRGGDR